MAASTSITEISKCFIKPLTILEAAPKEPVHLAHWDLSVISGKYIQTGLLFPKPGPLPSNDDEHEHQNPQTPVMMMNSIIDTLKDSLSRVLVHFYPLAGTLETNIDDSIDPPSCYIYIDCSNPQGAEFVHAVSDLTMDDILSPVDVPAVLRSFFLYTEAVNHDGHTLPLLGVQVTELVDGYFIACSMNHVVGDGTAFWHFFNSWAEIARSKGASNTIPNQPILKRWFPEGYGPIIKLPFTRPEEFIDRYSPKQFRERIFHFSTESMTRLELKANQDRDDDLNNITSFQALCALLWKCITRARGVASDETARCFYTIGDRATLDPPLSSYYIGNSVSSVMTTAQVGELLIRELGWSASLFNEAMNKHNKDTVIKKAVEWIKAPAIRHMARLMDGRFIAIGLSRFNLYGNDFGWGNPVAIRRAAAIKFDGRISAYQGREGGSSLDVVCCLAPETMTALESDEEFMGFVSTPTATTLE